MVQGRGGLYPAPNTEDDYHDLRLDVFSLGERRHLGKHVWDGWSTSLLDRGGEPTVFVLEYGRAMVPHIVVYGVGAGGRVGGGFGGLASFGAQNRNIWRWRYQAVFQHAFDVEALRGLEVLQSLIRCVTVAFAAWQVDDTRNEALSSVRASFTPHRELVWKGQVVVKTLHPPRIADSVTTLRLLHLPAPHSFAPTSDTEQE